MQEQLVLACKQGNYTRAQELLERGTRITNQVYYQYVLYDACRLGYSQIVRLLLEYNFFTKDTLSKCIITAIDHDNIQVAEILLDNGVDIHTHFDYPLRAAVQLCKTELVKKLIQMGANVNALNDFSLRIGARRGNYSIVKLLLYSGANAGFALEEAKCEKILNLLLIHTKTHPEKYKEKWYRLQRGLVAFQRKCVENLWVPGGVLCIKNYKEMSMTIQKKLILNSRTVIKSGSHQWN